MSLLLRRRARRRPLRRPWRLRTRLSLALLVSVAPITALLVFSYVQNLKDQRQSQVESVQTIGRSLASNIDSFARDMESVSFAASLALSEGQIDQSSSGAYLRSLRNSYGLVQSIFVTDANGTVLAADSSALEGMDLSGRGYVGELASSGGTVWTEGVAGADSERISILHGRVVTRSDSGTPAYLFFAFYPAQLLARLPADLPADSNTSLLDAQGRVLLRTGPSAASSMDVSTSPQFQSARNGEEFSLKGTSSPVDPGPRYGVFVQVSRPRWVLTFTRPASAIDGPFQARLGRDLLIATVLVAGGVVFMLLVASRLSKPLSSLAATAEAIARGEQPLVPTDAADADLRKLERAMESMTQAISEREDRLLAQNRVLETLERVGETIATELDFEEAVSSITVAALQLTQAHCSAIYYQVESPLSRTDSSLKLLGVAGEKTFPLAADDPLVRRTLTGEVLDVPEIGVFPAALQPPQLESGAIVHSFLGIPIRTRFGEVHGGLFLLQGKQAAFSRRHVMLAAGLARRAAIVVENARLYGKARQQQEELRKASMAKSEFIGMMSHELRTPITTIFGGAHLLRTRRANLDADAVDEMIVSIEDEAERLYRLVEDLLTLARSDMYENIEIDILSLAAVVDQAVRQFNARHPKRIVNVSTERNLPLVLGESAYLQQVLYNLIGNADKYSPADRPIEIEILGGDLEVTVKVMDRGPGVAADEIESIFESFYRSKTTAKMASGKGLGLTVCKRLIEAMSGQVWAVNREGGGLEACFSLPIAAIDVTDDEELTDAAVAH